MADFDPDAYLSSAPAAPAFDPDAYLSGKQTPSSGFSWSAALTDVPSEIGKEAGSAWSDISALGDRSEQGPIEGLMTTGKAALAVPRLIASPLTGAARSLIGHPMANLEHAAGEYINPAVAAKDNPEAMYETAKSDVDKALAAARPAGVPVRAPSVGPSGPYEVAAGKPTYDWNAPPAKPTPTGVVKQPDTEDFFDAADNNYANMRGYGVEIDPRAMNGVADNIMTELMAEGYRQRNAPKVFDAVEELRTPAGQNHEISDIDSVRKVLGRARLDPSERDAARRAINHIDDYMANLGNNPQDVVVNQHYAAQVGQEAQAARANYAVAKRSEDIDDALDQAERQAARSGSGGNINNAIRQRLSSLRNNKKKMAGWTDDEKAELDAVINGTAAANAARQAGKFAPHGIVSTMMSAGAGHMVAPGVGEVAVPAMGWIAKKVGDRLTRVAAERLQNVVKARSPLGKQTSINAAAQSALTPPAPRALPAVVPSVTMPRVLPRVLITHPTGTIPSAANPGEQQQGDVLRQNEPDQGEQHYAHGGRVTPRAKAEKALPPDHVLGMRVPKGGSSCSSCKFLKTSTSCGNPGFVRWNGGKAKLPAPNDQYCCDLYQISHKRAAGGAVYRESFHPKAALRIAYATKQKAHD